MGHRPTGGVGGERAPTNVTEWLTTAIRRSVGAAQSRRVPPKREGTASTTHGAIVQTVEPPAGAASVAKRLRWLSTSDGLLTLVLVWVAFLPIQFRTEALGGDRFAPSDFVILLVPAVAGARLMIIRSAWSLWHTLLVLLMPFGLIVAALLEGSVTRYAVLNKTLGLFLLFLAYVAVTIAVRSWSAVLQVVRLLVLSTAIVNLFSIGAYFLGWQTILFNDPDLDRLTGMLVDPNAYGGLLVVTLALMIPATLRGERLLPNVMHYVAWITLPFGVILTQSRSAWIALAAVFFALGLASPRRATRALGAILLVVTVIAIAAGAENRASFVERADRPQTIDSRLAEFQEGFDAFVESPALGIGLGAYYERHEQIVHFTALWVLADMGVVGLVILLGFVGVITVWGIRLLQAAPRDSEQWDLALGLLLAHVAMIGLSMGIEALYQRHWWLIMALIAAMRSVGQGQMAVPKRRRPANAAPLQSRFYRPPSRDR